MSKVQYRAKLESSIRRAIAEIDNTPNDDDQDILTEQILDGLSAMRATIRDEADQEELDKCD